MSGRYESTAASRTFAHAMWDLFAALQAEGFTEAQALHVIGTTIAASIAYGGDGS